MTFRCEERAHRKAPAAQHSQRGTDPLSPDGARLRPSHASGYRDVRCRRGAQRRAPLPPSAAAVFGEGRVGAGRGPLSSWALAPCRAAGAGGAPRGCSPRHLLTPAAAQGARQSHRGLSGWAGTNGHVPLAFSTRPNRCRLNPALPAGHTQDQGARGRAGGPTSPRAAPLDAVQKRTALPLLQVLALPSQPDPTISSASFVSARPRNPASQEASVVRPGSRREVKHERSATAALAGLVTPSHWR